MEDKLNQALSKAVEKGLEIAEKSGQFLIDQAPDLLQEFYRWHLIKNSLSVLISIISILIIYKIFKIMGCNEENKKSIWKQAKILGKWYEADHPKFVMPTTFLGFGVLFLILIIATRIMNLIKILIAPKIYLIEYLIN